jgi:hypothetical protein
MGIVTFTPEAKSTVKINEIKHGSKISTPAAVGIGVGIFIGLILVSILILAIRTRRRLRSGAKKHDSQEFGKPELEDNSNTIQTKGIANIDSLGRSKQFAQGDGLQRTELEADGAVEIDTQGERVEIGGEREMHEIGTDREMYELPAGNEKAELPAGDGKAELPAGNEEAELDGCGGLKPL